MKVNNNSSINDYFFEVIHELKNSITVCNGYLDIIGCDCNVDIKRYVFNLKSEINRSRGIIDDFMLYRKFNVRKEIMDINVLINDLCNNIDFIINNKSILFNYDIFDDEVYINGDYNKLKQVFINLLKNSVESLEDSGGVINFKFFLEDNKCFILIKDNGCGMSDDVVNKIKNGGFTSKKYGNGIGVNFSNRVILEHNGDINYNSKIGEGTEVVVSIPVFML